MPITKLEHFLLLSNDIEKTRAFYCDVLGLRVGPRPTLGYAGYWIYIGAEPAIQIGEAKSYTAYSLGNGIPVTTPAPGTGPVDHIALSGSDYEEIRERLLRNGVVFTLNIVPESEVWQLFLDDPNGVKIKIAIHTKF